MNSERVSLVSRT